MVGRRWRGLLSPASTVKHAELFPTLRALELRLCEAYGHHRGEAGEDVGLVDLVATDLEAAPLDPRRDTGPFALVGEPVEGLSVAADTLTTGCRTAGNEQEERR